MWMTELSEIVRTMSVSLRASPNPLRTDLSSVSQTIDLSGQG